MFNNAKKRIASESEHDIAFKYLFSKYVQEFYDQ